MAGRSLAKEDSMSRLSILSVLMIGLPLIGCAQAPTQNAAVADSQATPIGSHVKGAAPDPLAQSVTSKDFDRAPAFGLQQAILDSAAGPSATISGH
jgi:hypothetical protein